MNTKILFCSMSVAVAMLLIIIFNASGQGIVVLEGYEHGVALCGVDEDTTTDVVEVGGGWFNNPEGYMWAENNIMYVVNVGHMNDSQVSELIALATVTCEKY